jgi:DNA-binding LytR/AlgR family response regulator
MRYLIFEDEIAASMRLQRLIQALRPASVCIAVLRGVDEALHWFDENDQAQIDVAFVDIQLSDGLSFELFTHMDITFPVIFTTAYDQYAIQAFQVHALDYLLKPIKQEQLADALSKFERYGMRSESQALQAVISALPVVQNRQRFVVKVGKSIRVVNVVDVAYFYSENKITYLTTFDGKRYALDYTLDQLEASLNPAVFYRANRQCIVTVQGIEDMHTYSRSRLKLHLRPASSQEVIVSTEKAASFKEWLKGKTS